MIKLNIGDIVELNGRIYRVENSAYSNGSKQGRRAIFKLLREKELTEIVLKDKGGQNDKSKNNNK